MSDEITETKDLEKQQDMAETVEEQAAVATQRMDVYSFSDLDTAIEGIDAVEIIRDLIRAYQMLMTNIMIAQDITDKVSALKKVTSEFTQRLDAVVAEQTGQSTSESKSLLMKTKEWLDRILNKAQNFKTEDGKQFHKGDFAYTPDDEPSHWKLRLTSTPGGAPDAHHTGMAMSALSSHPMHGNAVQIPAGDKAKVRAKVMAAWKKTHPGQTYKEKTEPGMFVWKENDLYRWFAIYSNCYRDNDLPPEIISKESHKKFVELVDNKEVPYPELRHWHIKGTKYGVADWVAFDEDTGFALASGYILPGYEHEAELTASKELFVSHGMPSSSIERDSTDKSVIIRHITTEISDLPTWAAANQLTQFSVFTKEIDDTMAIPEVKKKYLKEVGFTDEKIALIETALSEQKEIAESRHLESKEKTEVVETPAKVEVKETPSYVTKEEVAKAVGDVVAELVKSIKELSDKVSAQDAKITESEKKNKESMNLTPAASLSAMILGRAESAIGSKETVVRSNSPLLKDGPHEMQVEDSGDGSNTFPIVNSIIRDLIGPKK
jgi:hypothetical protein